MRTSLTSCAAWPRRTAVLVRAAAVTAARSGPFAALLLAASAALAQAPCSTIPPEPKAETAPTALAARYDAAHEAYEVGHFESAFAEFAALADAGHCGAVRIALQMLRYGKATYATEFRAQPERVQQWQGLPACRTPAQR